MLLRYAYYLHIRRIKRGFHRNIEEMSSHIFSKIGIFDSRRDTYLKFEQIKSALPQYKQYKMEEEMVAENIYHRGHIYDSPESLQLAVYLPNKKCANLIFLYLDKTNHNSVFPTSCSHVIP